MRLPAYWVNYQLDLHDTIPSIEQSCGMRQTEGGVRARARGETKWGNFRDPLIDRQHV